jgi:hypothetical protein
MKKDAIARRGIHMLIALAPLYYALPVNLPIIGLHRWTLVVVFFSAIMVFEACRLRKGITFMGLRPHEKNQIASFAWAAAGITATLWLSPHDIASAALVGMALVDPLAGELRLRAVADVKALPLSMLVYFVLAVSVLLVWDVRTAAQSLVLCTVGTVLAVFSERAKIRYVDDDFLMAVLPAVAMTALSLVL